MLRSVRFMLVGVTFVTFAAPAGAQGPTVANFLARANPIREQGLLAMLSPEMPALRAEAKDAVRQMKADNAARARAGRPIYCKPADEPDPAVEDVVDALGAIPQRQQRTMPLKDGIARVMARFYPCR